MEDSELLCPKCDGEMELGFVMGESRFPVKPTAWYEGTPQVSLTRGVKVEGQRRIEVDAYRCVRCGYVELYAGLEGD